MYKVIRQRFMNGILQILLPVLFLLICFSLNITAYGAESLIRTGDTVTIYSATHPQLNGNYQVSSSGTAAFPLIGEIRIANRTASEAESFLSQLYSSGYLRNVSLKVNLQSVGTRIYVLGDVRAGGNFSFNEGCTVLRALAMAGGPTVSLKNIEVRILRSGRLIISYPWEALSADPSLDISIMPDDVIAVIALESGK